MANQDIFKLVAIDYCRRTLPGNAGFPHRAWAALTRDSSVERLRGLVAEHGVRAVGLGLG